MFWRPQQETNTLVSQKIDAVPLLQTAWKSMWLTAAQLHTKLYDYGSKEELEKAATSISQAEL